MKTTNSQSVKEEKIGQISPVGHWCEIQDGDLKSRCIGSVIHTEGQLPREKAAEWQVKCTAPQKEALNDRLGLLLHFRVDAVRRHNTYDGATIFTYKLPCGCSLSYSVSNEE
ncbi:MAG: hypothetical protein AAF519_06380 [Bacteroidota bacterium]